MRLPRLLLVSFVVVMVLGFTPFLVSRVAATAINDSGDARAGPATAVVAIVADIDHAIGSFDFTFAVAVTGAALLMFIMVLSGAGLVRARGRPGWTESLFRNDIDETTGYADGTAGRKPFGFTADNGFDTMNTFTTTPAKPADVVDNKWQEPSGRLVAGLLVGALSIFGFALAGPAGI